MKVWFIIVFLHLSKIESNIYSFVESQNYNFHVSFLDGARTNKTFWRKTVVLSGIKEDKES